MKNVIIVPTYNEKENVRILIPMVFKLLPTVQVMVADDNSPDGTALAVEELKRDYPNLGLIFQKGKGGLGKAYLNAFKQVLKDNDVGNVIMMDADLSLQPKYLPLMLEKSKEYSVVIGSRYVSGSKIIGWKLWRRILSLCGNLYCRVIFRMPIKDYTCGFIVIRASLLRKINLEAVNMFGYAFILELKYLLYRAGATFFEVPITFVERVEGESKISNNIIREGILAPWRLILKK